MREWISLKTQNGIVEPKEVEVLIWEIRELHVIAWPIMKRGVIRNGNDGITKSGNFDFYKTNSSLDS